VLSLCLLQGGRWLEQEFNKVFLLLYYPIVVEPRQTSMRLAKLWNIDPDHNESIVNPLALSLDEYNAKTGRTK